MNFEEILVKSHDSMQSVGDKVIKEISNFIEKIIAIDLISNKALEKISSVSSAKYTKMLLQGKAQDEKNKKRQKLLQKIIQSSDAELSSEILTEAQEQKMTFFKHKNKLYFKKLKLSAESLTQFSTDLLPFELFLLSSMHSLDQPGATNYQARTKIQQILNEKLLNKKSNLKKVNQDLISQLYLTVIRQLDQQTKQSKQKQNFIQSGLMLICTIAQRKATILTQKNTNVDDV